MNKQLIMAIISFLLGIVGAVLIALFKNGVLK